MRIYVRGYLGLQTNLRDQPFVEIDSDRVTLRDVLNELEGRVDADQAQTVVGLAAHGTEGTLAILLNGRHASHLPDRLDTVLKEGDQVAIFPPAAGG
jgi:molybdopterin converting factor small subunit